MNADYAIILDFDFPLFLPYLGQIVTRLLLVTEETIVTQRRTPNPKSVVTFSHDLSGIKEQTKTWELGIELFCHFFCHTMVKSGLTSFKKFRKPDYLAKKLHSSKSLATF